MTTAGCLVFHDFRLMDLWESSIDRRLVPVFRQRSRFKDRGEDQEDGRVCLEKVILIASGSVDALFQRKRSIC